MFVDAKEMIGKVFIYTSPLTNKQTKFIVDSVITDVRETKYGKFYECYVLSTNWNKYALSEIHEPLTK